MLVCDNPQINKTARGNKLLQSGDPLVQPLQTWTGRNHESRSVLISPFYCNGQRGDQPGALMNYFLWIPDTQNKRHTFTNCYETTSGDAPRPLVKYDAGFTFQYATFVTSSIKHGTRSKLLVTDVCG